MDRLGVHPFFLSFIISEAILGMPEWQPKRDALRKYRELFACAR